MHVTIPAWGPASLIEILWTAFAFAGALYAQSNYRDSRLDRLAVQNGIPVLGLFYDITLGVFRTVLIAMVLFFGVGLLACISRSATGDDNQTTVLGLILGVTMLVAICALAYLCFWAKGRKHKLKGELDAL